MAPRHFDIEPRARALVDSANRCKQVGAVDLRTVLGAITVGHAIITFDRMPPFFSWSSMHE